MNLKSTLVTGAAGFIGSSLVEQLLKKGHKVIGIDNFDPFYDKKIKEKNLKNVLLNNNFSFFETDISKKENLINLPIQDIGIVIHLAAKAGVRPSIESPDAYIKANIDGTLSVLEFMRLNKCAKLVFASSSSVYGNNKKIPFEESDSVDNPISPYAFTKKAAELLIYNYHYLYNIDAVNLRFFTVYGERQRPDLAIHKFVKLIDEGSPITLFGKGDTSRDYTYIADIVNGIEKAVSFVENNNNIYEIINIGNNSPIKLIDMVNIIYKAMGKTPNIEYLPMQQGDVDITFADISKAKNLFGYEPKTTFEEGISQFVEWYKNSK